MEEIAVVLSSLAGACTAVALDRIPKIKHNNQTASVNLTLENQLQSLRTEKEILTKTIARLHQQDSDLSRVHKDKLLIPICIPKWKKLRLFLVLLQAHALL